MLNGPAKPGPQQLFDNSLLFSEPPSPSRIMIHDLNVLISHKPNLPAAAEITAPVPDSLAAGRWPDAVIPVSRAILNRTTITRRLVGCGRLEDPAAQRSFHSISARAGPQRPMPLA